MIDRTLGRCIIIAKVVLRIWRGMMKWNISFEEMEALKLEAKTAAKDVLDACWSSGELPIDPLRIAEKMGLQVKPVTAKSNVAGGLLKKENSPPIIFFNEDDAVSRRRFTIAHELGHYYRHFTEQHEFEYMDYRDQMSSTGSDPEEIFANQFAANLLMPENHVKTQFNALEGSVSPKVKSLHLANTFAVSVDAMSIRLNTIGFVQ